MEMSIIDEIKAMKDGKLLCSDQKRAACVTYCKRRIATMQDLLNSGSTSRAVKEHEPRMREKIKLFSEFITWAERQDGGAK